MSNLVTSARPYAKAVFSLAQEQKNITAWSALLQMAALVIQDVDFRSYLQSPKVSSVTLVEVLQKICQQVLFDSSKNFLQLLAMRHRLMLLPDIAMLFEEFRAEQEKLVTVKVISATPLNNSEQQKLIVKLSQRLQRDVKLQYEIKPEILGGLIIQADDLVIDASVRGKLVRLGHILLA